MAKVFRHPAALLLETSRKYARGEIRHVEYMRALSFILRKILKRTEYECGDVLYVDQGNYKLLNLTHPFIAVEALCIAPGGVCPTCGVRDWHYMSGAVRVTMNCAGCGSICVLNAFGLRKEGVRREKVGKGV